jgi:lysozyme
MISRRGAIGGLLTAAAAPGLAGCGSGAQRAASATDSSGGYHTVPGLDAVIDISHNVTVTDFAAVRRSKILGVIHKVSEGGDWFDPSYATRKRQAEAAGLLWGGYHFGTRQYSGVEQARAFLSAAQPGPSTLLALDVEHNDRNPRNTMQVAQAEAFVQAVYQATGRLPVVYVHPRWANGEKFGRAGVRLNPPIGPQSLLARCDLWVADYREQPEIPYAWADKGWRLWQYVADESENDAAYGTVPRAVAGVGHCDRNLFNGDTNALYRFWRARA